MDLSKMTTGDKLFIGGGIVLFIASFFPWLGVDLNVKGLGNFSDSASAWSFTLLWLAVIIGTIGTVIAILKIAGVDLPDMGGSVGTRQLIVGATALVLVVIKTVVGVSGLPDGVSTTRGIGLWIGLLACIVMTAGGFSSMKEEKAGGSSTPPMA